jgi:hypothetical protein
MYMADQTHPDLMRDWAGTGYQAQFDSSGSPVSTPPPVAGGSTSGAISGLKDLFQGKVDSGGSTGNAVSGLKNLFGGGHSSDADIAKVNAMGAFAEGGYPTPGLPALVGENGPEIVVPQVPTTVIPNPGTRKDSAQNLSVKNSADLQQNLVVPNSSKLKDLMPSPMGAPPADGFGEMPPLGGLGDLPALPGTGLKPIVTNPRQQEEQKLQDRVNRMLEGHTGPFGGYINPDKKEGFWGKLSDAIGSTGTWAKAHPEIAAQRSEMSKQLSDDYRQDEQERDDLSKRNLEGAQAGYYGARSDAAATRPMTHDEAVGAGHPEWEGMPVNSGQVMSSAGKTDANKSRESIDAANNQNKLDLQALRNKVATLKPEQRDDKAIRLMAQADAGKPLSPDDQAYLKGYGQWVDQTKTQPGIARMQALARYSPVQVVDPNDPNKTEYVSRLDAMGKEGTAGMGYRAAASVLRSATSGDIGKKLTAFRTANDHMAEMNDLAEALQNGDTQIVNEVGNRIARWSGGHAPTDFGALRVIMTGEIANIAASNGATVDEQQSIRNEISQAESPEQLNGVLRTWERATGDKARELQYQVESGMKGNPAGASSAPAKAANPTAEPPRPAGLDPNKKWNANGPKGPGWYR